MNVQPSSESFGRLLIIAGLAFAFIGVIVSVARVLRLGSLPGDVHLSGRGWQAWLPFGTSIVLSLVLTLLLNLLLRRR